MQAMEQLQNLDLVEKRLDRKVVYQGMSYQLWLDRLLLPNGVQMMREHLHHPGGVAVLAVDESGRCAMVRQYRHPIEQITLEIPAGKLDKLPHETPLHAAHRELREETGFVAEQMISLGQVYPSPGLLDEVLYLFLARGLQKDAQELDEDEFIHVEWMDVAQLEDQLADGTVNDVKALCAVFRAKMRKLL